MASQIPEDGREHARPYDERRATITAAVGAVLMCAGIIGLFMFITWLTYATD
jgi:hypothetical protein